MKPGDRVALLCAGGPEFEGAVWGILLRGAVLVPLNPALPAVRLLQMARAAGVSTVVHDEEHAEVACSLEAPVEEARALAEPRRLPGFEPDRPAAVLFTSGTTGEPRGAVLTHGNFAASAAASAAILGTGQGDTWLCPLPLHHVGGLALLFRAARDGFSLRLPRRFDPDAVAAELASGRVTHASLVARMLERTLEAARAPFSPELRAVLVGGGPVPELLMARARARGLPVCRTYGLTEACSQVATQRIWDTEDGTCGLALPGVGLALEPLDPRCAEGEILVRGPTVMAGYLEGPRLAGDWLRTGDVGRLDARGHLTVLDRRTDLIVSGGENVYPAEVEAVLGELPAVEEACVIGIPDPSWGSKVCAVVRLCQDCSEDELYQHCRERLASFQIPRRYEVVGEPLPRTASGKLRRGAVRERYRPPAG